MTNVWGATSTTDDVLSGIDLHGKRILVTGVSAGIGVETARALAAHGAHVTGAARDLEPVVVIFPRRRRVYFVVLFGAWRNFFVASLVV